uniref:Uncharacterized protein n=1 Tax=Anguilla anguilla TaxID=7936 RepID=A0A0E9Q8L7_ANGAN
MYQVCRLSVSLKCL